MGIAPIERLQAWWAGFSTPNVLLCNHCRSTGPTSRWEGGHRYCSAECAEADGLAQEDEF